MGLIELSKLNYFPSRKPNVKLFNHGALPFLVKKRKVGGDKKKSEIILNQERGNLCNLLTVQYIKRHCVAGYLLVKFIFGN